MALISKMIHEYFRCVNWRSGMGECCRSAAGWLVARTAEQVTFAEQTCQDCGTRNLNALNAYSEQHHPGQVWEFVPAVWQVEIHTRHRIALLAHSLDALGIAALPQENAEPWPIAA